MSIKIVTDSTADIPEQVAEKHGITVIPLYINVGDESYRDGVDLSREEFYRKLPDYELPPLTSAPGPEIFRKTYERLADEGGTEILSMHISASLSATYNVAQAAAQTTATIPVTPYDPGQLTLGTGLLAIEAAKAAADGKTMSEILEMLQGKSVRTYTVAALDTLEFLRRSGRVSHLAYGLGSLLKIKPLLKMHRGVMGMERVRTRGRATDRLIELMTHLIPLEELAVVHTYAPEHAETLWQKVQHLLPEDKTPMFSTVTPVIGAHIGPGAAGFVAIARTNSNREDDWK